MKPLKGYIKIIRPTNCIMMGIGIISGYIIASGSISFSVELLAGIIVAAAFTAFANVTNDIIDYEIDKINQPHRPLPSGEMSRKQATYYSIFLLILGLFASVFTKNIWFMIIPPIVAIVTVLYNVYLKKYGFVGNVVVSFLVALSLVGGSLIAVKYITSYTVIFSSMAFFANLGREVHKGIVDVEGDKTKGIRTIAITKGERYAKAVAIFFYMLAVILSTLPAIQGLTNGYYLVMAPIVALLFLSSSLNLWKTSDKNVLRKEKDKVRVWMLLAMLTFIVGGLRL
jgi:geranylgeranylglycerol-phosphate geranylgeranyltransferase